MNKIFPIQQWFYPVVFLAVFLRLLVRLLQQIKHMHGTDFYDVTLWSALAAVLCFHVVLLVIASSSQKFKDHSGPLIYIGLLLILYLSILIDHCFLHWPEPLILGLTLMGSIIFLYYRSPVQLPPFHWQWEDALIFLWLANSLLFFLEYNFDAHRVLYQDEGTFWYAAAANMVHQGTLKAQILGYPGGGLHPFGIPFIAALPLLFCKAIPMAGLYFMPVIILLMGSAFLNRIKKEPWIFIFFLTALFCAFNNRSWPAALFYQLGYGEGISAVILLWLTYEMVNSIKHWHVFLMSLLIGLLALTKSPLTLTFLPFLGVFLFKRRGDLSWVSGMACLAVATIPSVMWRLFIVQYQIDYQRPSGVGPLLLSRILKPNTELMALAFNNAYGNAGNLIYFGLFSLGLWMMCSKKILEGLPSALLLAGVVLYYGYYTDYGSINGDYASFLRYIMPASLALFYLGAVGFNVLMERLEHGKVALFPQLAAGIGLIVLLLCRLF